MNPTIGSFWITSLLMVLLLHEGNATSQKEKKMMHQRTMRQSGQYANYQAAQLGAYSVRGGGGVGVGGSGGAAGGSVATAHVARPNIGSVGGSNGHSGSVGSGGKLVFKNAARPSAGIGAYTFGGAASGRPAFGPTFALGTGGAAARPQFGGGSGGNPYGPHNIGRPQQNAIFRGAIGRPGPGPFQG